MTKEEWEEKIKRACTQAGTYHDYFDIIIEQLAGIMETKDSAEEAYEKTNRQPVILYTNKAGHANLRKNPALAVINEQNAQALAYWRDLGLTPSGYKKLTGETIDERKSGTFEQMLEKLEI